MNDPLPVEMGKGLAHREDDGTDLVNRHRRPWAHPAPEITPFGELDDQVVIPIGLAEVEDRQDVRVRNLGHQLRFSAEAGGVGLAVQRPLGLQEFDRDESPQGDLPGEVDLGHPPFADLFQDDEARDLGY